MKVAKGLAAAAVVLTVPMGAVATADAAPVKADSAVLGSVTINADDPSVATVTARYICGGDFGHLWVSVKQAADGRPDAALRGEGSSAKANAWIQSHPQITCDGTWRTETFTVDTLEQGFGTLQPGQAWVQFCLYAGDGGYSQVTRFAEVR
jgi:hypothetical protein